jgi:hypothetical protein
MATANNQIYTTGIFNPVIDRCDGCDRVIEVESQKFCKTYSAPVAKWKLGICNFASHVKLEVQTSNIKVNPLKASKRAMGKK